MIHNTDIRKFMIFAENKTDLDKRKNIQKIILKLKIMSETQEDFDSEKERVRRFAKFAAFLFILVVAWYGFDLAQGV